MTELLKSAAEDVLLQGLSLLNEVTEDGYARLMPPPYSASVGKHYRHVLDHFTCLLRGLSSRRINYDSRERDARLESDLDYAFATTLDLVEKLRAVSGMVLKHPCLVAYTVGYGDRSATEIPSTVARELAFSISHAVHHYALIRLICAAQDVALPVEFGVAPSTLKYQLQAAG
jgi:hypothetical protein